MLVTSCGTGRERREGIWRGRETWSRIRTRIVDGGLVAAKDVLRVLGGVVAGRNLGSDVRGVDLVVVDHVGCFFVSGWVDWFLCG